jgi:hypothetical protein
MLLTFNGNDSLTIGAISEEVVRFLIVTTTGIVVVVYAFGLEEESPWAWLAGKQGDVSY